MYFLCNCMFLIFYFLKKSKNGEKKLSGMDIFYLRKKRCESIYRGVPSYPVFFFSF